MSSYDNEQETIEIERISQLAENLVYRLPGCAEIMIRKTLQEVYRDFCRRSCCLRTTRHFDLNEGEAVIPISPLHGGVVEAVTLVEYNRRRLECPADYSVHSGRSPVVTLKPSLRPGVNGAKVKVEAVEIPALGSEEAPQWFIDKYGETLCDGVVAKLTAMNGRPWSDNSQAAEARIRYENAVGEARARYYAGADAGGGRLGQAFDVGSLI